MARQRLADLLDDAPMQFSDQHGSGPAATFEENFPINGAGRFKLTAANGARDFELTIDGHSFALNRSDVRSLGEALFIDATASIEMADPKRR